MQSFGIRLLQFLMTPMIAICCLFFSSLSFSQQLTNTLVLRLGPGIGFPVNIELPSGAYIDVEQRRNDWLLIHDHRGEGGWAKIEKVDKSGGLAERQAWRLTELKQDDFGFVTGRLYQLEQNNGISLGWRMSEAYKEFSFELEKTSDAVEVWQSISSWYDISQPIYDKAYYGIALGLGYSWENAQSHVFSKLGQTDQAAYAGIGLHWGYRPVDAITTGLSIRHLRSTPAQGATANVVSWFWSFGI